MEVLRLGATLGLIYVQCFNDNIKGEIILLSRIDGNSFCGEIWAGGWLGGRRSGNFRLNRHRGSLHSRPFLLREVMMKAAQLLLVHGTDKLCNLIPGRGNNFFGIFLIFIGRWVYQEDRQAIP